MLLVLAGFAVHHDMAVRKLLALAGAIAFPVAGFAAIAPAFRAPRAPSAGAAILDGVRVLAIATLVTLGGALVVVGLLSTPLTMLEIDRFTGVKLVLALPPLIALLLYLFTPRWGSKLDAGVARRVAGHACCSSSRASCCSAPATWCWCAAGTRATSRRRRSSWRCARI